VGTTFRSILPLAVQRILVLGAIGALLGVAGATDTQSARPPVRLTYSVEPSGGLCLARADGSHRVRLTRGKDRAPSWSPKGRLVVFSRQVGTESRILIANARGRVVRRLTQAGGAFADPTWSADGKRIAYVSREGRSRIVIVGNTGQALGQVLAAPSAIVSRPSWAPGGRLAYAEHAQTEAKSGGTSRIVVVNADGKGRRVLAGQASDPAWSPNGSMIAYVSYPSRLSDTGSIVIAKSDGSSVRHLTRTGVGETRPAWSPGGQRIAFTRVAGGKSTIVVVGADGSSERVVVGARGFGGIDPAWRPAALLPQARWRAC
jgi:Tol biopolymer transport system component